MAANIISAEMHPDYHEMVTEITKVRDCIEGAARVKRERYTYLPHPSQIDQTSREQIARYNEYLAGAEYEGSPDRTRRSLLGKMRLSDTEIETPDRTGYLAQDADGDGLSMIGAIESTISQVMQMKFHLLVADYQGLSDVDLLSLSLADVEQLNPRAAIKQYSRENIVNWSFARVNGVMQLSWVMLLEHGYKFNEATYEHDPVESYLILALDENGDYYQQKIVYDASAGKSEGEREYLTVSGQRLKWLPIVVVADEQIQASKLPKALGFLSAVCDAELHRYRVSAVYKEVQRNLAPTTYTSGWKSGDIEVFKEANGGRTYISTGAGAVNNMPEGVTTDIVSASMEMDDFHWYFTESAKKIRQLGGNSDSQTDKTATEANINAQEQNALLNTIADNVEAGFARAISYCAMFEGLWSPDDVEKNLDQITVSLPRDFASPRLTVDEIRALIEMRMQRLVSKDEFYRQIKNGGWMIEEVEQMIEELDNEEPLLLTGPVGQ